MWIDVKIPFDEKGRLGMAYNRALKQSTSEWVLFLDHDVFLCNPHWYTMCLDVIISLQVDSMAACVCCACGGEHHVRTMKQLQWTPNSDIENHINVSKEWYSKHGTRLVRIDEHVPGYFMLLKREVALKIGFVQSKKNKGINNIDVDFGNRLMAAGYHIYLMPGLYIYHRRGMKHLKKEFKNG